MLHMIDPALYGRVKFSKGDLAYTEFLPTVPEPFAEIIYLASFESAVGWKDDKS